MLCDLALHFDGLSHLGEFGHIVSQDLVRGAHHALEVGMFLLDASQILCSVPLVGFQLVQSLWDLGVVCNAIFRSFSLFPARWLSRMARSR